MTNTSVPSNPGALSADTSNPPDPGAFSRLLDRLEKGKLLAQAAELSQGQVRMWTISVRFPLKQIFGENSSVLSDWPNSPITLRKGDAKALLAIRILRLEALVNKLCECNQQESSVGLRVFIGHGRSQVWRELKDFIQDRLRLPWEEFNRESPAGIPTSERLIQMLASARFAFLVMTAEDQHADASLHARGNVIHEVGLFQGKLGWQKAIVLLEDGCSTFSNIHGINYIGFPRGEIRAAFEEVRLVLEREQILNAS